MGGPCKRNILENFSEVYRSRNYWFINSGVCDVGEGTFKMNENEHKDKADSIFEAWTKANGEERHEFIKYLCARFPGLLARTLWTKNKERQENKQWQAEKQKIAFLRCAD